jgi:hypothetical protein
MSRRPACCRAPVPPFRNRRSWARRRGRRGSGASAVRSGPAARMAALGPRGPIAAAPPRDGRRCARQASQACDSPWPSAGIAMRAAWRASARPASSHRRPRNCPPACCPAPRPSVSRFADRWPVGEAAAGLLNLRCEAGRAHDSATIDAAPYAQSLDTGRSIAIRSTASNSS